jgi:hypothetical protein
MMKPTTMQHANVIPLQPAEMVDALQYATFPVTFRRAFVQYPGDTDVLETNVTVYENGTIFQNGILIYPGQDPSPISINIPADDLHAIRTQDFQEDGEKTNRDPVLHLVRLDPRIPIDVRFPGLLEIYSSPDEYQQIPQFSMTYVNTGLILDMSSDDILRYTIEITSHPKLALEGGLCENLPFNYLSSGAVTELEILIRNSGKQYTLTIKPNTPIAILTLKPRIQFVIEEGDRP